MIGAVRWTTNSFSWQLLPRHTVQTTCPRCSGPVMIPIYDVDENKENTSKQSILRSIDRRATSKDLSISVCFTQSWKVPWTWDSKYYLHLNGNETSLSDSMYILRGYVIFNNARSFTEDFDFVFYEDRALRMLPVPGSVLSYKSAFSTDSSRVAVNVLILTFLIMNLQLPAERSRCLRIEQNLVFNFENGVVAHFESKTNMRAKHLQPRFERILNMASMFALYFSHHFYVPYADQFLNIVLFHISFRSSSSRAFVSAPRPLVPLFDALIDTDRTSKSINNTYFIMGGLFTSRFGRRWYGAGISDKGITASRRSWSNHQPPHRCEECKHQQSPRTTNNVALTCLMTSHMYLLAISTDLEFARPKMRIATMMMMATTINPPRSVIHYGANTQPKVQIRGVCLEQEHSITRLYWTRLLGDLSDLPCIR